jgi:hypothetical protein
MSWITEIVGGSAGTFIKDVGDTVKQFVTTDKDRLELETKLQEMQDQFVLNLDNNTMAYEGELTKRLQADMQSDSWLSKNIRPMTLIFILVMYSVLSITSGTLKDSWCHLEVTESYVQLLGQWGMLIMSFYFGGRTIEKVAAVIKNNQKS